ncbi:MAG: hypothetical protein DRP64_11060, partial [Verrucomicrobia bacterium]
MKKLVVLLAMALVATTSMALVDYGNSVHWTGTGDWTNQSNWAETPALAPDWAIPGWVVGNPYNTVPSTDLDWNGGYAHIDSGTVNITPTAKPDGTVNILYAGSNIGASIMNISGDFMVRDNIYFGYQSTATDVATINQSFGNVSFVNDGTDRTYLGRGNGTSIYNLSGGTFATPGDWDNFGTSTAGETGTFVFNQT